MRENILMGIGNRLRRDDGVGNYVAEQMQNHPGWHALDCGTVPENYTSVVKKRQPGDLVLVDAAEMDLAPGEFRLVDPETIQDLGGGTHALPLYMVINYMRQYVSNGVWFIGIQPDLVEDGEGLTPITRAAGDAVVRAIKLDAFRDIAAL